MQMENAADGRYGQMKQLEVAERVTIEVIVQRSQRMVVSDQPQLSDRVTRRHVRSNVAQNILMPEQYSAAQHFKKMVFFCNKFFFFQ